MSLNLKPHSELRRNRDDGTIYEDDIRIITFRLKTFQKFIDGLYDTAGLTVGNVLLTRIGSDIGRTAFDYSKNTIGTENDLRTVLDYTLKDRGWGTCDDIIGTKMGEETHFMVKFRNCPVCADKHERAYSRCDMLSGLATGFLEAYLGRKSRRAVEVECAAKGGSSCVFRIIFTT